MASVSAWAVEAVIGGIALFVQQQTYENPGLPHTPLALLKLLVAAPFVAAAGADLGVLPWVRLVMPVLVTTRGSAVGSPDARCDSGSLWSPPREPALQLWARRCTRRPVSALAPACSYGTERDVVLRKGRHCRPPGGRQRPRDRVESCSPEPAPPTAGTSTFFNAATGRYRSDLAGAPVAGS